MWVHDQLEMYHDGSNLQIQHVESKDAGYYTCLASNVAGNDTKQYLLQVLSEYHFFGVVILGSVINLYCSE